MPRITKRFIDGLAPVEKRTFFWDEDLKGFGLVVQPSGAKTYLLQYRNAHGQSRRFAIGQHGTLTPDEARKSARELAAKVALGDDPMEERREQRQAESVGDLLDAYLGSQAFAAKAESTRAIDKGRIERHLRPLLGTTRIEKLTPDAIRRTFASIRDGKTAKKERTGKPRGVARVSGGEGTARMAIRLLKAVFAWAIAEGRANVNPCAGVDVGQDGERDAVLAPDEYAALFRSLDHLQATKRLRPAVADAIRVIALTGARRGEIARLTWQHVDLERGLIVLPPTRHKTGRKTGKPRVIGLPEAAQAIIAAQPEGAPEGFVFRPAKGEGCVALAKPWRMVRAEAGLSSELGLHGLRHSLATQMAIGGAEAAQIMSVLGHRSITTSQRYVHIAKDARAQLAERAAAGISAALTGTPPAEVVPLSARTATES